MLMLAACSETNLKDEVSPYLEYFNADKSEIVLPSNLYEKRNAVSFAGREGSVSMGYRQIKGFSAEGVLTWTSNDAVTHEEFESFKSDVDKYYGFEANEKRVSGNATPRYSWYSRETHREAIAAYDSGYAVVEFYVSLGYS